MATTGTRTPARATPTSTGYGAAPGVGANEDVLAEQSTGCAPVGALKVTGAAGSPINPIAIG